MDRSKVDSIVKSMNVISSQQTGEKTGVSKPISRILNKIAKPIRTKRYDNPTIRYFQSISSRRIRSSQPDPAAIPQSATSEYQPFSRAKLYKRIQTFQKLQNWNITQYNQINPLVISLHGWRCDTKRQNHLICDTCNAQLVIKLSVIEEDEELTNNVNEKLISVYLEKLVSDHKDSCAWKKQWCSPSLYEIKFENNEAELKGFEESYIENMKHSTEINGLNIEFVIESKDLIVIQDWLNQRGLEYDGKVVEVTILGWKVVKSDDALLLVSESDGRRLLVSNSKINLLNEHHDWSNYTDGYKVLLKIIKVVSEQNDTLNFQFDDVAEAEGGDSTVGSVDDTLERLEKLKRSILQ